MKVELDAGANQKVIRILQAVPLANMARWTMVDRLIKRFTMRAEEEKAVEWRPVEGRGRVYRYNPKVKLARDLDDTEAGFLLAQMENPPRELAWTHETTPMRNQIVVALGGQAWE